MHQFEKKKPLEKNIEENKRVLTWPITVPAPAVASTTNEYRLVG